MQGLGGTGEDPSKSDRGRFYPRAIDPKTKQQAVAISHER
jgi:hypothetical protein